MKPNPYPGFFVAIGGLDGSGTTTQVKLLEQVLRKEGLTVHATKEPTDNVIGGLIRGALTGVYRMPPEGLQLLFVADRAHHLDRQIIPILQNHSILIADRFCWSTIAFGSVDLNMQWLINLHRYCFLPDLSIFLRVPPKICVERLKNGRFDFELFEKEEKMWKVWKTYEWLAKKFPEMIKIVEGERKPSEVMGDLLKIVRSQPKFRRLKRAKSERGG